MKLAVINYGNFVMVGKFVGKEGDEIGLKGALVYEGGGPEGDTETPQFSMFPLGSPHMSPDPEMETRLVLSSVMIYTLLDMEDGGQDICVRYRSFWDVDTPHRP